MNERAWIKLLVAAAAWFCGVAAESPTQAAPTRTPPSSRENVCPHALAAARQTLRRYDPERGTAMAAFTAITNRRSKLAGEVKLYLAFRQGILATQKLHRVLAMLRATRPANPAEALRKRRLVGQITKALHTLRLREARADDRVWGFWRHLARLPRGLPGLL